VKYSKNKVRVNLIRKSTKPYINLKKLLFSGFHFTHVESKEFPVDLPPAPHYYLLPGYL
jgi:hypothetical protein